jgi:hypothetical protein
MKLDLAKIHPEAGKIGYFGPRVNVLAGIHGPKETPAVTLWPRQALGARPVASPGGRDRRACPGFPTQVDEVRRSIFDHRPEQTGVGSGSALIGQV